MTVMKVRLANSAQVKAAHKKLIANLETAVIKSMQTAGRTGLSIVNSRPGFKPRTGALQRATKSKLSLIRGGARQRFTNRLRYAAPIEYGSRQHFIRARNADNLHFKVRGQWVKTPLVLHPGNRPYKFMYRAWRGASRATERALLERMRRIAARF